MNEHEDGTRSPTSSLTMYLDSKTYCDGIIYVEFSKSLDALVRSTSPYQCRTDLMLQRAGSLACPESKAIDWNGLFIDVARLDRFKGHGLRRSVGKYGVICRYSMGALRVSPAPVTGWAWQGGSSVTTAQVSSLGMGAVVAGGIDAEYYGVYELDSVYHNAPQAVSLVVAHTTASQPELYVEFAMPPVAGLGAVVVGYPAQGV